MNIWDRTETVGRRFAEKEQLREQAERAKSWPRDAEDETVPLVGMYKGMEQLTSHSGRTYSVIILLDRNGVRWRVNRSAAVKRAFADQGEPKNGDGVFIQYLGQREYEYQGETRTYKSMIVRVVPAENEMPTSPTEPDDDLPF